VGAAYIAEAGSIFCPSLGQALSENLALALIS
jgi:hypothetical protein